MRKRSGVSIAVIALALVAISASPVLAVGGGALYLHAGGHFDGNAPTAATPQQIDSPPLTYAGGNQYKVVGIWTGDELVSGPVHVWLGLRNSDDQGTNFDIRTTVTVGGNTVTIGRSCVTGLTRNPNLAQDVGGLTFASAVQVVSVRVEARIGTIAAFSEDAPKCAGHSSATGLRLYYDSVNRQSGINFN